MKENTGGKLDNKAAIKTEQDKVQAIIFFDTRNYNRCLFLFVLQQVKNEIIEINGSSELQNLHKCKLRKWMQHNS